MNQKNEHEKINASHALLQAQEHITVELEPGLVTDIICKLESVIGLSYEFTLSFKQKYLEQAVEVYVMNRYKAEQPMIDGFAKGKVPFMVIKKHYSHAFEKSTNSQIKKMEEYVIVSHLQYALSLISKHYGLSFISEPRYMSMDPLNLTKDFTCSFKIDIEPEIADVDLSQIDVTTYDVEISEQDIDKAIVDWCGKNYRGVDLQILRPAQHGDIVIADIIVKGSADMMPDVSIMIGGGKFVKEFEDAFIGRNIGEEFTQALQIPENFSDKNIAGNIIQAKIIVKNIKGTELYKADENMFKAFGVTTLQAAREKISQQLHKEGARLAELLAKRDALKQISDKLDMQLPETVLDNLIFQHVNLLAQRINIKLEYPITDEQKAQINPIMKQELGMTYDVWFEKIYPSMIAEAKSRMFLLKYSKQHDIQIAKMELDQAIAERAMTFPSGLKDAIEYFEKDNNARQKLINQLYEEKLLSEVYANVKKTHVKSNMSDLIKAFDKLGADMSGLEGKNAKNAHHHDDCSEDCTHDHSNKTTNTHDHSDKELKASVNAQAKDSKKKTGAASKAVKI